MDELLPSIESLLHNDELKINQDIIDYVVLLLDQFESKASPTFKAAINKLKRDVIREEVLKQLGIVISE